MPDIANTLVEINIELRVRDILTGEHSCLPHMPQIANIANVLVKIHIELCEGYSNWYAQRPAQYALQQSKLAHSGGGNINRWSYISLLVEHSSSQHIHILIWKHHLQGQWTLYPSFIFVDCKHIYLYLGAFVLASVLCILIFGPISEHQ